MTDTTVDHDPAGLEGLDLLELLREEPQVYAPVPLPEGSGASWGEGPQDHHGQYVYPGRRVLVLPGRTWAARPEDCPDTSRTGEWVLEGAVLVCRGCGLDST